MAPPHATPAADRRTVSAHAQEVGAVVAINANYFGGALNLQVHFHAIVAEALFAKDGDAVQRIDLP